MTLSLVILAILSQTHPEIVNLSPFLTGSRGIFSAEAPANGGGSAPETAVMGINPNSEPTRVNTQTFVPEATQTSMPVLTSTFTDEPTFTLTMTDMPSSTPTLLPTQTLTVTPTMTFTPSSTPTITQTFTPSVTPYPFSLTAYSLKMSTPLQGIGFGELASIISQQYNVIDIHKDTGHHGVDLGSYDYHGKLIYDWPILSVFSGKVAGIVVDRYPIGNTIIIETPYNQLPQEIISLTGIKPGQSLYHMYSHMINPTKFKIGDDIQVGQTVGQVGKSQTVEAHLHFETCVGPSAQVLPSMAYYDGNATEDEKKAYLYWRTSGTFLSFDPMNLFANLK